MRVGFTGTRHGMSFEQKAALYIVLKLLRATELRHGDCVGADEEAHDAAWELGLSVIVHPPLDPEHRAHCEGAALVLPPKTHFARNRDIVDNCELLVGTPLDNMEPHRVLKKGGTWYTLDYSRRAKHPTLIIWRNGTLQLSNGNSL